MEIEFKDKDDETTLKNVDPIRAMEFAIAFLEAMAAEALEVGTELKFTGFHLKPGSVIVVTEPNNKGVARQVERRVAGLLRGGNARTKPHVQRLLRKSEETRFVSARTRHGKSPATTFDFATANALSEPRRVEMTTVRAVFLGIDAKTAVSEAHARFTDVLTGERMRLRIDQAAEARLVSGFRQEVDLEVELERDITKEDTELSGRVVSFDLVTAGDALGEWREWFAEVGTGWSKVTLEEYERERDERDGGER